MTGWNEDEFAKGKMRRLLAVNKQLTFTLFYYMDFRVKAAAGLVASGRNQDLSVQELSVVCIRRLVHSAARRWMMV